MTKWYRHDRRGIKFVINCDIDKKPDPISEEGFTDWKRGVGPNIELVKKKRLRKPKKR